MQKKKKKKRKKKEKNIKKSDCQDDDGTRHFIFQEDYGETKSNELRRQKLERQNSWHYVSKQG